MKQISDPITDKEFAYLDIPTAMYEKSSFLRSIKKSYLRYKVLTDKQVETFKKAVKEMKSGKKKAEEDKT